MAQHDYVIANGTGAAVRSDLNNALAAIVSQNSGATEPATTYAFQFWADTTTNLLKLRNSANNAWVTLFQLDGEWSTLPVENGTAAAPSIYFKDSGTDTGFYSPGTDQVAISTGGTGRLFINSSGSVGIGTSSPSNDLDVLKTASGSTTTARIGATATSGANNATLILNSGGTGNATLRFDYEGSTNRASIGVLASDQKLTFGTAGSTAMTIDASQRLGIGTSTPSGAGGQVVEIYSSGSISELHLTNSTSGNVGSRGLTHILNGADAFAYNRENGAYVFGTNNTERARIDSSGRLLVGTSSASAAATSVLVQGNGSSSTAEGIIRLTRGTTTPGASDELGTIAFGDSNHNTAAYLACNRDGGTWNTSTSRPTRLSFSTTADGASSPTEAMRIAQSGRVGVNINPDGWSSHPGRIGAFQATLGTGSGGESLCHVATNTSGSTGTYFYFASSNYTSSRDSEFYVVNNGNVSADGTFSGGGADYAEYFEWDDSNPTDEDRRGLSVVLTNGNKIRVATSSDEPSMIIGVVSAKPAFVGDSDMDDRWKGKYLKDDFGEYVVGEDGGRVLNPDYDETQPYVLRSQRPEWDVIGLVGKLRIKKGQPTGDRWIKMRDISDSVEEWLVR